MSLNFTDIIYLGKAVPGSGGGGGGDQHNLGWYATQSALETAHPTASNGDWAIVGATDTVWVWDSDTTAWKDTDTKGQVTSVNGQTGAVTVDTLPDQTGQSGKFLTTDGTNASWSDKPLVNTATQTESLNIRGSTYGDPYYQQTTVVGTGASARGNYCVTYGRSAQAFERAAAIGGQAYANSQYSSSFGWGAVVSYSTVGAIQLGKGTNSTPGTFSVGLTADGNTWGNYEVLSADGTIPAARHAALPAADGTYTLQLVISNGVPTLSWVAE